MDLYVSDLDGTLLDKTGNLSSKSKKLLNESIEKNINFTVATARTPATVTQLLDGVNLKLPIIIMNGAAIFDINKNQYLHYVTITSQTVNILRDCINKSGLNAFIYTIKENHIFVYHSNLANPYQKDFYNDRNKNKYKTFVKEDITEDTDVVYFTILDKETRVNELYNQIKDINGIYIAKYRDVYHKDYFNLEIYDINASKANAINHFKNYYNFSRLITFGDNTNDIPMFQISDECYAVGNAVDELKEIATKVIGDNSEDSVAKYISFENNFQ